MMADTHNIKQNIQVATDLKVSYLDLNKKQWHWTKYI